LFDVGRYTRHRLAHFDRSAPDFVGVGTNKSGTTWWHRLIGLHRALFLDASPSPAKYALSRMGLCSEAVRLPLVPTRAEARPLIDAAMAAAGL
jgi:4-hydroxy-tetrahydrodipicolinate synthase